MTRIAKLLTAFVVVIMMLGVGSAAFAASISVTVSPNPGTANSVYIIEATWSDTSTPTPKYPTPNGAAPQGSGMIVLRGLGSKVFGGIPMFPVRGTPQTGLVFRAVVSGGLNLSHPLHQAEYVENGEHIYMPALDMSPLSNNGGQYVVQGVSELINRVPIAYHNNAPIWYSPVINSGGGDLAGTNARTIPCSVIASAFDFNADPQAVSGDPVVVEFNLTYYSSSGTIDWGNRDKAISYGWGGESTSASQMWIFNDQDYLTCYPDAGETLDPLSVGPSDYTNDITPDEATGNSIFDFRIRYNNLAGLPPRYWMTWDGQHNSGVVLYLGRIDQPDYEAYPMELESGEAASGVYKYTFAPAATQSFRTGLRTLNCYTSLEPGVYRYFFGTSDDSLYIQPDDVVGRTRLALSLQNNVGSWGGIFESNGSPGALAGNPLDPAGERKLEGMPGLNRLPGHRYTSGRVEEIALGMGVQIRYDDTIFVDRVIRAPGLFEDDITWGFPKYMRTYPFPSNEYPKVTCVIDMKNPSTGSYTDNYDWPFIDAKYGYGKYWGTLQPYKRGVIPLLQGDCAVTTKQTENVFRIVYRQMDGKAPIKSQIWISDGMGRSGAKPYSMVPDDILNNKAASALTTADYKKGVWYSVKKKLEPGPHSYYYTFSDGLQTANWPTRPDNDPWVYGAGISNDCVPGPYVNNAPILSEGAVNPGSGRQGTNFVYTVRYKDADGQRPYKAHVYIETAPGKIRRCEMQPVDKADLNESNISTSGVLYYFDTGTVQDLVMETGQRKFYFEFSDDWGDPSNHNDKIEGEIARFPSAPDSWMQGPEVIGNVAPRLTNASVKSTDGSSTPATVWNFEVTYSDANNDAPASLMLYIGQLQRDGKTVIWDEGNALIESDPSDQTFNDGKDYYFQTRLGGVDLSNDVEKQYYYSFYASDGELIATYNSSTDPARQSEGATAFYRQQLVDKLTPVANHYYAFEPTIAQRATVTGSYTAQLSNPTDVLKVVGVYATEDLGSLGGKNLYVADGEGSGLLQDIVTTRDPLPDLGSSVWVEYIIDAPIVGPVSVDQPAPEGVLVDAEIYSGTTPDSALRLLLDGQRSGWTGSTDGLDTNRFAVMRGVLTDSAGASSTTTVLPDYPELIASVEGVFVRTGVQGEDPLEGTNYYRPTAGSHFSAGDKLIPISGVPAADAGKTVLIKYSDMRFTYIQRGIGVNESPASDGSYNSYFVADTLGNSNIKGNSSSRPYDGIVGVWANPYREFDNYFDPYSGRYSSGGLIPRVSLTKSLLPGTGSLWVRYYQLGNYHIDRGSQELYTMSAQSGKNVYATYMFGRRLPQTVGQNTAPVLTGGSISSYRGSRTTTFVYSVTYSDSDGPNGQQPSYVRVYVDGVPHDMTRESAGTPDYKQGARYTYSTTLPAAGSHTFHFEASDGTATAVYDWYNVNNQERPTSGQRVREIDGPWINNPPTLTNVEMNPTPTARLGQVVDVSVIYSDIDNDEPYFFDPNKDLKSDGTPLGLAQSRSPRLWISSSMNPKSVYVEGTINAVNFGDGRTIQVALDQGYSMNGDSLIDYYLQIIPKSLQDSAGRLYLIKGNSADTIQVSTKSIAADGVKVGDKFRVNGILMRKEDSTDTNYTDGCKYTITLPALPEGRNNMLISARSREDKPGWLKEAMARNNEQWLPYSDPAAETFPQVLTELIARRPTGNSAPVLTGTRGNTLSQGLRISENKIAQLHTTNVLTAAKVALWDAEGEQFNKLFVTNVFRNADSMYLDPADRRDADGYFNAATPPRAYDLTLEAGGSGTVATEIALSKAFAPILPYTELVQFATIDKFAMLAKPDFAAAIGNIVGLFADPECTERIDDGNGLNSDGNIVITDAPMNLKTNLKGEQVAFLKYNAASDVMTDVEVDTNRTIDLSKLPSMAGILGIYLGSDEEMTGENFYDVGNPFVPGSVSIRLTKQPTEGTVNILYIPFPPAYVEFRGAFVDGTPNSRRMMSSGSPLMLSVDYRDADNDAPAFHDNVDGFILVDIFNEVNPGQQFPFVMPTPEPQNFTSNVRFQQILDTGVDAEALVPGESTYAFVASDGYSSSADHVWLPARRPNGYKLFVNNVPTLTDGAVLSLGRDTADGDKMNFALSVLYTDGDGQAAKYVRARIRNLAGDVLDIDLSRVEQLPNYKNGVLFNGNISLPVGEYDVIFVASDGVQIADTLDVPKKILVSDENIAPVIIDYSLDRVSGKLGDTFVFTADYSDADGDSPLVNIGGYAQEGMKLIVTETNSNKSREWYMTRRGSSINYRDGVSYQKSLTGRELMAALGWSGKANYIFTVSANDGVAEATMNGLPKTKAGPILNVPYIKTMAVVDKDTKIAMNRAAAGREVLLSGTVAFPYDGTNSAPAVSGMNLVVDVPGGASIGVPIEMINFKLVTGTYKKEWIGEMNAKYALAEPNQDAAVRSGDCIKLTTGGDWRFQVGWGGDTVWDALIFDADLDGINDTPDYIVLSVGGPLRTVAVSDPGQPSTSAPLIDMITPPMFIGNPTTADAGFVFGYERALDMQIVRWDPSSKTYRWYGMAAPLEMAPGQAVWMKPKNTYPSQAISVADINSGLLMSGNLGISLDPESLYRLVSVTAKDYPVWTDNAGQTLIDIITGKPMIRPCTIALKTGWNQFGNIFYNWKKDANGNIALPRTDVGIALGSVSVSYHGVTKTLIEAKNAGWIRDYAWRYDAESARYVLVSPTVAAAEKSLKTWSGYWIKALVDCDLIIDPNSTNATPASANENNIKPQSIGVDGSGVIGDLDVPPAPIFKE